MSISSEVYDALLDWYVTSEEGQEALSQDTTKKSNSSPLTKSTSSPLKKSTSSQKTTKNDTHKTKTQVFLITFGRPLWLTITQSNPAAPTSTKRIRKMHCSAPESPSPEPTVQNPPPAKRARRASPAGNDVSREPTPSTRKARKQRIESESDASDTEISAAKPTRPERQTEDQLFKRPDTTQVFARFIKPTLGVSKTSKTVPMVPSSVSPSATSSPATNPPATSPPATSLLPASGHRTPDAACASLTIRSDSVTPSHSKLNPSCQSSRYHTPVESIAPFEGANNQSSLDPPPPNQRPSTSQTPASSCNPGRRPVDNDDKFISRLCDVKRSFEDVSSDLRFDRCSGGEALGRLNTAIDAFHSVLKPHV
ncbi:hypothetical protein VNI00_017545 [Paramarasmius palmivorus]|uniref:Uncharacterized protein n=1 Tax=Paramarasmius palmivorus TaxID=297713 RepID=A0AAW0B6I2_9AGAR